MADGRHFEKKLLNSHISVTVWPIFRFWWNLVWCCILEPGNGSIVKILNFWKSKMSAAAILNKTQKSWYLHNGLIDLHKTWYADAIWASYPLRQIKKLNFTNPRCRTADFDEIWHVLRNLASYSGSSVKILTFWKFKMSAAAIFKISKIGISPQRFDRYLRNLVRWCRMVLLAVQPLTVRLHI